MITHTFYKYNITGKSNTFKLLYKFIHKIPSIKIIHQSWSGCIKCNISGYELFVLVWVLLKWKSSIAPTAFLIPPEPPFPHSHDVTSTLGCHQTVPDETKKFTHKQGSSPKHRYRKCMKEKIAFLLSDSFTVQILMSHSETNIVIQCYKVPFLQVKSQVIFLQVESNHKSFSFKSSQVASPSESDSSPRLRLE